MIDRVFLVAWGLSLILFNRASSRALLLQGVYGSLPSYLYFATCFLKDAQVDCIKSWGFSLCEGSVVCAIPLISLPTHRQKNTSQGCFGWYGYEDDSVLAHNTRLLVVSSVMIWLHKRYIRDAGLWFLTQNNICDKNEQFLQRGILFDPVLLSALLYWEFEMLMWDF